MSHLISPVGITSRMSISQFDALAEGILRLFCPKALQTPTYLDILHWVEYLLPTFNIHVTAVESHELPGKLAVTEWIGSPSDPINILIHKDLMNDLIVGGPRSHRARVTVLHELGHAVLHVPELRKRLARGDYTFLLELSRQSNDRNYPDPEWQAWMFAGCVGVPLRTLMDLPVGTSFEDIAKIYGFSPAFLRIHIINRLGMQGRFT